MTDKKTSASKATAPAPAPADTTLYDAVVVGGGPAGATAAHELAKAGRKVAILDRDGRIKPCGGAIPPRAIDMFEIDEDLLVARIKRARMIAPSGAEVVIPINGGFVGMVDREHFDEWLRQRAVTAGAERHTGTFVRIEREEDGTAVVCYREKKGPRLAPARLRTRAVIGADGARSQVAAQEIPGGGDTRYVIAYHEIVRTRVGERPEGFDPDCCDVVYDGSISPDFYGWVFPHGPCTSVGMGTEVQGADLKASTADLRARSGLASAETIRKEGAPIPLQPLKVWDNGRDVVLAGDAAGVVAPSSGEGIFYAMYGGRVAADAVDELLATRRPAALKRARRRFMRAHGGVFWILGKMQDYWYGTDERRERFVHLCRDVDIQELTFDAYMNKELVKARPLAHLRIFARNVAHLTGLAKI